MTAYSVPSDPTNVVGKRIGAWVLDLVIYLILGAVVAAAFGGVELRTYEAGSELSADFFCDAWLEENNGFCFTSQTDGEYTANTIEGGPTGALFWAVHLVGYAVIQGLLGGSLGKLALGLRVVDEQGKTIGIGRSLVRTIAWIIDAITCGLPIVGGVSMVSSKGHRRVGDFIAGTYVVGKDAVGVPPMAPAASAPAGAWGQPAAGSWPPPAPGGFDPSGSSNPWTPPAGPVSGPPVGGPTPGAPASVGGGDGPTWDPARNAYIQYDRDRGEWLQWDDQHKIWAPISQ